MCSGQCSGASKVTGSLGSGSITPYKLSNVSVTKVSNGWVIYDYDKQYVFRIWNEVVDKLKELFAIEG